MSVLCRTVTVETDASGAGVAYLPAGPQHVAGLTGLVVCIDYEKIDFADTANVTVTTESSGATLWSKNGVTASKRVYPRAKAQDTTGSDLDGSFSRIPVCGERIKVAVSSAGANKSGRFTVVLEC